jgi:hypothetical protein
LTNWHVRLQFDDVLLPGPVDEAIDALFAILEEYGPTSTVSPGRFSLFLTVDATSPEAALRTVRGIARDAMRKTNIKSSRYPVGVEIYTDEEIDRANADPLYPEVVGVAEVAAMLRVSKQRVSELTSSKRFPRPLYKLAAGPVWVKPEIEAFVEKWERKPGRPRKTATG